MDISSIFDSVLEISIISSIIGIVIILLRQLLNGRVNSKWIYIIWFILLFKLLVPIKIESFVSIFNFTPEYITENNYIENAKMEYENLQQDYNNYINNDFGGESANITYNQTSYELQEIEEELKNTKIKNNILEYIIPTIWFIGFIVMSLWLIITNIILNLKLNKNYCRDERLENILEKCKVKMQVKRKFYIVINNIISTPALFGIFKIKILIPKEILKLSDENLEYILLHELSHYKRKDILIKYILLFIQSIHWFNPIIWLCFRLLRNDLELATDEYSLKYLDENKYKSYANALIETLNIATNSKIIPSLIGMVDNKENIKRRIIMIKSLEIFKKKKIIITIICILLTAMFSLFLLTSPITSNTPSDNFYISSINKENKIHMGAYKWKYIFGEVISDSIDPLEYAKSINKVECDISEKISIVNEGNDFQDIKQIDVLELENNINILTINDFTNTSKIEFTAPDTIGTYYYLVKVYYLNESYVEYVFSIEVTDNNEIIADDTEKVAKLNTLSDWNDETKKYKTTYIKEISEKEVGNIDKIIERAERFLGTVTWANIPDYEIIFNDSKRNKIEIRISDDAKTISIEEWNDALSVRTIYAEDDVNYLLNLLGKKNKYASIPVIDFYEYNQPMDIYWCGNTKLELGTYGWKTSTNGNLSNFVNSDAISPKEILKDKESIKWGSMGTYVTINYKDETNIKKLPKETKVIYKIYKIDEDGSDVQYKEATRMIDGSYYLTDMPTLLAEYIIEINMSFGELSNNSANYCAKFIH